MARELRIEVLCDACLADDGIREDSVTTVMLTVGNGKPRELDLCAIHLPPIQAALDMLDQLGHPADQPPAKARPKPELKPAAERKQRLGNLTSQPDPGSHQWIDPRCKLCPHVGTTPNAMWQHARQVHELTRAAYRAAAVAPGSALAGDSLQDRLTG